MTAQPVPQDYKRLSQTLPALKGLAIFLVVVYHLWGYTKGYQLASEIAISSFRSGVKGFLEGILNIFLPSGRAGGCYFHNCQRFWAGVILVAHKFKQRFSPL
jgi:hypothetical protein